MELYHADHALTSGGRIRFLVTPIMKRVLRWVVDCKAELASEGKPSTLTATSFLRVSLHHFWRCYKGSVS